MSSSSLGVRPDSHLVVCVLGAWGHVRPMLGFLARIVKTKHTGVITFITAKGLMERVHKEWGRHFEDDELKLLGSLRFRTLEKSEVFRPEDIRAQLGPVYKAILEEQDVPHPTAFLTEAISPTTPQLIREVSLKPVVFLVWCPTSMNLIHNILEKVGHLDDTLQYLDSLVNNRGISFGEAANELVTSNASISSNPTILPDLPPIAGYELFPQEPPFLIAFGEYFVGCMRVLAICDGIVTASSYVVEPKGCARVAEIFQKRGGDFFAIGPLSSPAPSEQTQKKGELIQSDAAEHIEVFLETVRANRGERSLLYISFGSLFGPTEADKFYAWLDVILDMDIPMVLVLPPSNSLLPGALRERLAANKFSLTCEWAPQQYILAHTVTGAFLTHNGSNGTHESLCAGVPMISWPFSSDQPIFAIIVSQVLKVGYELNEVRRGHGLEYRLSNKTKPIGTTDAVQQEAREVLTNLFYNDMARLEMRKRVETVQKALADTWVEGGGKGSDGKAKADLERFAQKYLAF